ncbi:sulfate/molybdate ABC transporter ATP-binding protein [Arsenicibacter rosenii]|uniref:ABC transporter n=1 Tax=Arsenicibacter rosenii TaxID=1750698 RepID=A0A1S2VQK5_9BACT|nr:ATP-binding cassette domain-containing protein [Arsenicibacter rosenii]OIN61063.1 ABC transporter [Arsenicibacter rosenii]
MIDVQLTYPRLFSEGAGMLAIKLQVPEKQLVAVVGASGSGKTTLLRLLAGLEKPQSGAITVQGQTWLDTAARISLPPQKRSIGFVFQDSALFPNMTVLENIRFAAAGSPLISSLIESVGLQPFIHQKPDKLSGGQRQRVALARALVRRPQVLLLDEPFAALDESSGAELRQTLLHLHQAWGTTTLLVSHHADDVRTLADRVIRLEYGKIISDVPVPLKTASQEIIRTLTFDHDTQTWVIGTDTTLLRSSNPVWGQYKPGDVFPLPA